MIRLTTLDGLACPQLPVPPSDNGRLSGSWFDPSHDGEGYILEVLDNGVPLVYWFSYGPEGERRWFFGVGEAVENGFVFEQLSTTRGPVFGPDYNPDDLVVEPWGRLELEIDCAGGVARWESTEDGFPAGELDLIRLTTLAGLSCE